MQIGIDPQRREQSWAPLSIAEFIHPVPLIALCLLILNDHYWKYAGVFPTWATGKISDLAGILYFPLLLTALANTMIFTAKHFLDAVGFDVRMDYQLKRWKLCVACVATGILFLSIKTWSEATELYCDVIRAIGLGCHVTMDSTDLIALILLPIPYHIGSRTMHRLAVYYRKYS
jgi:hypothetical protein